MPEQLGIVLSIIIIIKIYFLWPVIPRKTRHSYTLDGGGVFSTASSFGGGVGLMPVLSMLTGEALVLLPRKYVAKLNERSAASNWLIIFNVDVRCPSQVTLVTRMST